MCLCISFWNYNYFGHLKGANEVNKLQSVLLCLPKALYYAEYAPMLHVSL